MYMYNTCIIIIISSLPYGRSLASMSSIYLYLQPFFSFLHNCLPSNRQSYPSLASLLVSFLSFFPVSSALTNCSLVLHVLSSSFSAALLFAPNISLPRPRPALLHSSSYPANSPSSILLHTHISKAFSLSTTSLFIVHVSQPYDASDHTNVLTIRFFKSLFKPFVKSSFELLKATFAIAILALTSSTQVPFSVITAPRYLNVVTCSTRCPSTTRFITLPSSRETTIAFVFLTFTFMSYFLAVSVSPFITFCSPCSVLATIP